MRAVEAAGKRNDPEPDIPGLSMQVSSAKGNDIFPLLQDGGAADFHRYCLKIRMGQIDRNIGKIILPVELSRNRQPVIEADDVFRFFLNTAAGGKNPGIRTDDGIDDAAHDMFPVFRDRGNAYDPRGSLCGRFGDIRGIAVEGIVHNTHFPVRLIRAAASA